MTKSTLLTQLTTKAAEATEAMEIIEMLTSEKGSYLGIFHDPRHVLVECRAAGNHQRYRDFNGPTLLDALRKAKAAWEEGVK